MPVRCTGITKAGVQCAKVATRSLGEGAERQWCPLHAPDGAVKDIPHCAGKLRNGVGCPSAPVYIAVFGGEEVTLCSVHMGVFNDTDGKSVQTPPKPKKKAMTRIAQPSTTVEAVSTEEGNGSKHRESGTLRERLISSTEELYEYIHTALEDTIRNAQKRRMTACPSCGHRFSVLIPDYGAVVAAANTLLAKTVSTSSGLEEEVAALEATPIEALVDLPTAQLKRLMMNRNWSTVRLEAEAETLEESIERHMGVLYGYADDPDLDELPKAQHAKRELLRLHRIGEQLERVMRSDLPLLPGEHPPYDGRPRPTLNRVVEPASEES